MQGFLQEREGMDLLFILGPKSNVSLLSFQNKSGTNWVLKVAYSGTFHKHPTLCFGFCNGFSLSSLQQGSAFCCINKKLSRALILEATRKL